MERQQHEARGWHTVTIDGLSAHWRIAALTRHLHHKRRLAEYRLLEASRAKYEVDGKPLNRGVLMLRTVREDNKLVYPPGTKRGRPSTPAFQDTPKSKRFTWLLEGAPDDVVEQTVRKVSGADSQVVVVEQGRCDERQKNLFGELWTNLTSPEAEGLGITSWRILCLVDVRVYGHRMPLMRRGGRATGRESPEGRTLYVSGMMAKDYLFLDGTPNWTGITLAAFEGSLPSSSRREASAERRKSMLGDLFFGSEKGRRFLVYIDDMPKQTETALTRSLEKGRLARIELRERPGLHRFKWLDGDAPKLVLLEREGCDLELHVAWECVALDLGGTAD